MKLGVGPEERPSQVVVCEHCGYQDDEQLERMGKVGSTGAWTCKSCSVCNTTYHDPDGYVTIIGYHRDLEVEFL
jgi:hypothetical protein